MIPQADTIVQRKSFQLILVVLAGLSTLISVNDCCISRFMIIHGHENMLHHFSGFRYSTQSSNVSFFHRGLLFFFVLYGSSGGIITFLVLYCSCSYEVESITSIVNRLQEFKEYAIRNGKKHLLVQIKKEDALIAFDTDKAELIPAGITFFLDALWG